MVRRFALSAIFFPGICSSYQRCVAVSGESAAGRATSPSAALPVPSTSRTSQNLIQRNTGTFVYQLARLRVSQNKAETVWLRFHYIRPSTRRREQMLGHPRPARHPAASAFKKRPVLIILNPCCSEGECPGDTGYWGTGKMQFVVSNSFCGTKIVF